MKNRKIIYSIVVISFLLSIVLGMMNHETQSLWHLFTGDPGNCLALLIYAALFSLVGFIIFGLTRLFLKD